MPSKPNEAVSFTWMNHEIVSGLIMTQVFIVCYLLALDGKVSLLFAILAGIPLSLLFNRLLRTGAEHRHMRMAVVMLTVGGLGMLLGCSADLGRSGLLGLLSMCRSLPLPLLPDPVQVWQKMQLTPWTYIGMFIGGNLGMLLISELRPGPRRGVCKVVYLYVICNLGMLAGMLMGEAIAVRLAGEISQVLAAGLMMGLMLLGMTLGMLGVLAVAERLNQPSTAVA